MSRLHLCTIQDAPLDARFALTTAEKTNGFLPNLLPLLANAPVAFANNRCRHNAPSSLDTHVNGRADFYTIIGGDPNF